MDLIHEEIFPNFIDFIEFLIDLNYRFSWVIKIFIEDKKKKLINCVFLNVHFI